MKKILCCILTLSSKHQIWWFHVVSMQNNAKNMCKKAYCTYNTIILIYSFNQWCHCLWHCCCSRRRRIMIREFKIYDGDGRRSLSRLFSLVHVLQYGRSIQKLNWYERFQSGNREWKILCCILTLSSKPQIWWFHVVVTPARGPQTYLLKSVLHVQHYYLCSFNQWYYCFVAFS